VSTIIAIGLLVRCGVRPDWRRVLNNLLLALLAGGTAFVAAALAVVELENPLVRVVAGGATYALVILFFCVFTRSHLRSIMLGVTQSAGRVL
jgi:hypothetical protein